MAFAIVNCCTFVADIVFVNVEMYVKLYEAMNVLFCVAPYGWFDYSWISLAVLIIGGAASFISIFKAVDCFVL